ncbi:MAG: hypothetical protein IRZ03_18425 [Acidobacterium ailaaui]|nr:hypothetical protein [Pseudacidobacterium ailaaui]
MLNHNDIFIIPYNSEISYVDVKYIKNAYSKSNSIYFENIDEIKKTNSHDLDIFFYRLSKNVLKDEIFIYMPFYGLDSKGRYFYLDMKYYLDVIRPGSEIIMINGKYIIDLVSLDLKEPKFIRFRKRKYKLAKGLYEKKDSDRSFIVKIDMDPD